MFAQWKSTQRFNLILGGSYVTAKRVNTHNGTPRRSIGGVSGSYKKMAVLYKHFAREWNLDFSDTMLIEHYNYESYNTPLSKNNGFAWGKKWMGVAITMWKEDIEKGYLLRSELYEDPAYPHWWLDKVL